MGGCSIVFLMMLMMPFFCIYGLVVMTAYALASWVTGPAFPFWIIGALCDVLCLADLVRIAWRKYQERDAFPLTKEVFMRPVVLFAVGAVAFIVMTVLTGVQVLDWWNEMNDETLEQGASMILWR